MMNCLYLSVELTQNICILAKNEYEIQHDKRQGTAIRG